MSKGDHARLDPKRISDLDRTIHSPARLKIMLVLSAVEEADFTYIAHTAGLSRGNLSTNLQKLEGAGYVAIEKKFIGRIPKTLVQLTPAGSKALSDYSNKLGGVLDELRKT